MRQREHDLSDGAGFRMAVGNAGVRKASVMQPKMIIIVGDQHPSVGGSGSQLFFVRNTDEVGLGGGPNVDSAPPQADSNRVIHVFIEVKP